MKQFQYEPDVRLQAMATILPGFQRGVSSRQIKAAAVMMLARGPEGR